MTEIFKLQKKAELIIDSCTKLIHIDAAEKYVRRIFKVYTEKEFKKYLGKTAPNTAKDFRKAMKEELLKKLTMKKQSLQSRIN